jgi:hypothetical protein
MSEFALFTVAASHADPDKHLFVELARRGIMAFVHPPAGEALAFALLCAADVARELGSELRVVCLEKGLVQFVRLTDSVDFYLRMVRVASHHA